MLKSYSYIFELKDRFSGPIKKIGGGLASANAGLQRWGRNVDSSTAKVGRMGKSMMSLSGLLISSFITAGISKLGSELVDTSIKFENLESVLTNTLGSNSFAKQVISNIADFASKTPFQIDELTDSWIRLSKDGFKPNMDQMMLLSDLASSTGTDFNDLSNAIIDAQKGEFKKLEQIGINASKSGNQIAFTFKGQTREISSTKKAIQGYILSLGEMSDIQGASAESLKTTDGKLVRFNNSITSLKLMIAKGLKPQINGIIDGANMLAKKLKNLIPWISANATVFLRWGKLIAWATGIIGGFWLTAKTFLGLQSVFFTITKAVKLFANSTKLAALGQWALNIAMGANPIGLLVIGIAAAIGALAYLWTNFEGFRSFIIDFGQWMWDHNPFKWMIDLIGNIFPSFKSAFDSLFGGIIAAFKKVFSWIGGLFDGFKFKDVALDIIPKVSDLNAASPYGETSVLSEGGGSVSKRRRNGSVGVNKAIGASVSGGGGNVKNIAINIEALNKGGITVQSSTFGLSIQQIKTELERMLLTVVNDTNYG